MRLTRSHSARADGLGKTARAEKGYVDFMCPSVLKGFNRHLLSGAA